MEVLKFGNPNASVVLLQPVDSFDLQGIEQEISALRTQTNRDFLLLAIRVDHWNQDLSPWHAPAVFKGEDFGAGAAKTLAVVQKQMADRSRTYYLGGYSLAGLFALWAAFQTDDFAGIAAASPSVWFPGFSDYMKEHDLRCSAVYLSLGDKEAHTRNPVMATVGERICEAHDLLRQRGAACQLDWNPGNHFKDAAGRTAKAFAWLLNRTPDAAS